MAGDAHFPEVALADSRSLAGSSAQGKVTGETSAFDPAALMARADEENFPVASRLLGDPLRAHLLALYGFARLTDELGDSLDGNRDAALDWLEAELGRAYEGAAEHPLLQALTPTLQACSLPPEPFRRLIAANRLDQRRKRYESFEELLGYCQLSANPVGELVLGVFGRATPERVALSDLICSGLQIAEHLQDVAEDRRLGRVYLPARDMLRFGVDERELDADSVSPALRELLGFEVDRARTMLLRGAPLLATLRGRARLAVAAYLGGGLAALDAIECARFEVLDGPPRAGGPARARWTVLLLLRSLAGRGHAAPASPTSRNVDAGSSVDAAYQACERITRREARNFYYGIRLLPAVKRRSMCAVYAFARRVDDIGDGALGSGEKLVRLDSLSNDLAALASPSPPTRRPHSMGAARDLSTEPPLGPSPPSTHHFAAEDLAWTLDEDPVLLALADARLRHDLPLDALTELVEGVRMDTREVRYERFDDLLVYCRRVAGGVGRLCLAIFGVKDPRAASWAARAADELGVAMQLTNILRDLREDAQRGRLYLPVEDLVRFGITGDDRSTDSALALFAGGDPDPRLEALVEFEARRASEWFARGISLLEQLDHRSAACLLSMVGIYSRLLERIAEHPARALESRVSLTRGEKAWVALRSVLEAAA